MRESEGEKRKEKIFLKFLSLSQFKSGADENDVHAVRVFTVFIDDFY